MRLLVALLLSTVAFSGCLNDVLGTGGVSPKDLISDDKYDTWVIEIDYVSGHRPSTSAINLLESRLGGLVSKTNINIQIDDVIPAQGDRITAKDLQRLTNQYRDTPIGDGVIVTHVIYLEGSSSGDTSEGQVLGIALGDHETVGMFHGTIQDNTGGISLYSTSAVERVVLLHEIGHILGLVNNGLKMQSNHQDSQHPGHSSNQNSVMYWAVESTDLFKFLSGGLPDNFDANDRRDVACAGGKGTC